MLIVFDDMIADVDANKKWGLIVTELFVRGRKLNISLGFISQSYCKLPKTIRLYATHYFIVKIPNKREIQRIVSNHFSNIEFTEVMKFDKDYTKEPSLFLLNDTTLQRITIQIIHWDLKRTYYKMVAYEKIKAIVNKIEQNKAQYNLDRQTAKILELSSRNVAKYEFSLDEYVKPERGLLEKAVAIKIFEYSWLSSDLKEQTGVAKDQCKLFKDQIDVINNYREDGVKSEDD